MALERFEFSFYAALARCELAKRRGNEFQDFFIAIGHHSWSPDFEGRRPQGRIGDKKCDGYRPSSSTVYQCYAPREMQPRPLCEKIEEDYRGALAHSGTTPVKRWVLVHNDWELQDTGARIESRRKDIERKSERRNEILSTLSTGGALVQYRKLDNQLHTVRGDLDTIRRQLDLAERIDAMRTDLKVQKAEAERQIKQDLNERRALVEDAALVFDEVSQRLYDQPSVFDIVANKDGLDFKIETPEIASEGIRQVQIFCFDLTLSALCARRGYWPGFLIHDSHIFDGVDGRQVALALTTATERVKSLGGQYIVTMNSDDLEKAEREGGMSFADFIVEPELDDSPTGCLFGFRFATSEEVAGRGQDSSDDVGQPGSGE